MSAQLHLKQSSYYLALHLFLFLFGVFEQEEIVLPEPITITETVKEKELVMPRVDSTEIVSIAELATKTIVQVQVGTLSDDGEFLSAGGGFRCCNF